MILHILQASARIPADERKRLMPDDAVLARELLTPTDCLRMSCLRFPVTERCAGEIHSLPTLVSG
jgi:hypothetical protein